MKPLTCTIWHTEGTSISGIFTWMSRLRTGLQPFNIKLIFVSLEMQPFREAQLFPTCKFYDQRITNVRELLVFLKKHRDSVHIINHAFEYIDVLEKVHSSLLKQLKLVGICHTDQDYYYHHLARHARHLRGVIAVSSHCAKKLDQLFPRWSGFIPVLPAWDMPIRPLRLTDFSQARPLRLLFSGRILQLQKRVLDLPLLLTELSRRGVPIEMTVAGDGADLPLLRSLLAIQQTVPVRFTGSLAPWEMNELLDGHDIFLQLSEFEGASVSLMEAMIHSLLPVVTTTASGIDLLQCNENCLLSPIGDFVAMAKNIEFVHFHRHELGSLASAAHSTAVHHLRELRYPDRMVQYLYQVLDS